MLDFIDLAERLVYERRNSTLLIWCLTPCWKRW